MSDFVGLGFLCACFWKEKGIVILKLQILNDIELALFTEIIINVNLGYLF